MANNMRRRVAAALVAALLVAASCSDNPSDSPGEAFTGDDPAGAAAAGDDPAGAAAAGDDPAGAAVADDETGSDAAIEAGSASATTIVLLDCPDQGILWLAALDTDIDCALVTVPIDRAEPSLGTTDISVLILPGEDDREGAAPMAVLQGGPGGTSSELALYYPGQPYTRVFIDQRGTGFGSADFDCEEVEDVLLELLSAESAEADEIELEAYSRCSERLAGHPVLDHTHTAAHAADVVDVMAALGYDRWLLYGVSYGTTIALEVLRDPPDGLAGAVLDGVFPPDVELDSSVAFSARRALDELHESCSADADCSATAGDLNATMDDLIRRLNDSPLVVSLTEFESPLGGLMPLGETLDVLIDGDSLAGLVFQFLYVDTWIPSIPAALAGLAEGDEDAAQWIALFGVLVNASSVLQISEGTYFAATCADRLPFSSGPPPGLGAFEEAVLGDDLNEVCDLWDVPASPPSAAAPVTSDLPVLLLSGRYDPITPPELAAHAAEGLPNATLVVLDGRSHGVWAVDHCAIRIVDEFAADPQSKPDTSCADDPVQWEWVDDL